MNDKRDGPFVKEVLKGTDGLVNPESGTQCRSLSGREL